MKALKVKSILFSLLAMMAVAVFMTSCGQESVIEDNVSSDIPEEFLRLDAEMSNGNYTPEDIECTDESLNERAPGCYSTCNPWLSNITAYHLGGGEWGFSVNSSIYGICTRNQHWHAVGGSIVWQSGGFARMSFPNGGTAYAHLIASIDGAGCLVAKTKSVQ